MSLNLFFIFPYIFFLFTFLLYFSLYFLSLILFEFQMKPKAPFETQKIVRKENIKKKLT